MKLIIIRRGRKRVKVPEPPPFSPNHAVSTPEELKIDETLASEEKPEPVKSAPKFELITPPVDETPKEKPKVESTKSTKKSLMPTRRGAQKATLTPKRPTVAKPAEIPNKEEDFVIINEIDSTQSPAPQIGDISLSEGINYLFESRGYMYRGRI